MRRKKEKLSLHQKVVHHLRKHFHRHVHKALHLVNHLHHTFSHGLELVVILLIGGTSIMYANLTGLQEDLYRNNDTEIAQTLLTAMQNPQTSLKKGNLISLWKMDSDIENTFAKGYCTYGAARISPEFFPFIDSKTQQRTWGGNAVDRCKNASDTGYKIGSTPVQGALIIYNAGGRFGVYGHVGKVMHYDSKLKKIIVRDMARVARGTMSDRREDLSTASVKCYIYNSKTTSPEVPEVTTGNTLMTGETIVSPITGTSISPVQTGTISTTQPSQPHTSAPTSTTTTPPPSSSQPPVVQPPVVVPPTTPVVAESSITKKLPLTFVNLTDLAEHFITQYDLMISVVSKSQLKTGEEATITLEITKKTGEKYSGLLPFSFTTLATNDSITSSLSNVQLINDGKVTIKVLAQKSGQSTLVISMDGTKIGEATFTVQ